MKFIRTTRVQWYSFLTSMPLIDLALNLILYDRQVFHNYKIWTISFPLLWVIGLFSWYLHAIYDRWVENKYPEIRQSMRRIILKSGVMLFVMTPSILLIFLFYDSFHILGYSIQEGDLGKGLLVGLSVNLIFLTLWESIYMMDKHRESISEKEILKQMSLQQEFEVLKSQVNPHFLFNCFNTLSSLIEEDATKAEAFLDELSKVYRYLLRNNETGLSTLQNELRFIRSYFGLLKTRHGEAVQFQIETDKRYDHYLLPSLSLQLLVENAVKHGVSGLQEEGNILVTFSRQQNNMTVAVQDNGNGFADAYKKNGYGLKLTRERITLLNQVTGSRQMALEISSNDRTGTTIKIIFSNWLA